MVEPAIAITAMNIATLRPMFKNVFVFAKKRVDHSVDEEDTRPSGESSSALPRKKFSNSVSANEYSLEFAEMLGLSRVGVTTEISAGGSNSERDHIRRRFSTAKILPFRSEKHKNESQTELNLVTTHRQNSVGGQEIDWMGIKATTVITMDNR